MDVREKLVELLEERRMQASEVLGSMNKGFGAWYAEHLIAHGVTVQDVHDINVGNKWIPVTERLPESGKEAVMIALRWGEVDIGWCEDEKWGSEFVNEYEDGEVTHWMPLPPAPKEGDYEV